MEVISKTMEISFNQIVGKIEQMVGKFEQVVGSTKKMEKKLDKNIEKVAQARVKSEQNNELVENLIFKYNMRLLFGILKTQ